MKLIDKDTYDSLTKGLVSTIAKNSLKGALEIQNVAERPADEKRTQTIDLTGLELSGPAATAMRVEMEHALNQLQRQDGLVKVSFGALTDVAYSDFIELPAAWPNSGLVFVQWDADDIALLKTKLQAQFPE